MTPVDEDVHHLILLMMDTLRDHVSPKALRDRVLPKMSFFQPVRTSDLVRPSEIVVACGMVEIAHEFLPRSRCGIRTFQSCLVTVTLMLAVR